MPLSVAIQLLFLERLAAYASFFCLLGGFFADWLSYLDLLRRY